MTKQSPELFFKTKSLEEYCNTNDKDKVAFVYGELIYNSNAIEGIIFDEVETISDDDIKTHQILDHASAYKYVIDNHANPLTSKEILNLHSMLMSNIFRVERRGAAGEYRKNKVYIGSRYGIQKGGMHYRSIPKAMSVLEKDIQNLEDKKNDWQSILRIHNDFEIIHPFNDGNGRTGRLMLNWLSLKYLNEFIVVDVNRKKEYYESINRNRSVYGDEHREMRFYKDKFAKFKIDPLLEILMSGYSK